MTTRARTLFLLGLVVAGCETADEAPADSVVTPEPTITVGVQGVRPAILDNSDVSQLRWLEGTWRGSSTNMPPFFERYAFPDDSTMVVYSLRDETGKAINDSSIYELRDGHFATTGNGPRWIVTAIGPDSVHFAPLSRTTNSFTWKRVNDDQWSAVLQFPASGDRDASTRTYQMRRVN